KWSQKSNILGKTGYGRFTHRLGRFTRRQSLAATVFCGTGSLITTWAIDPPKVTGHRPNSVVRAVQPPLAGGLPAGI
ncbi:hypothetical protein B296_00040925, partial [Ensete ventricosum]